MGGVSGLGTRRRRSMMTSTNAALLFIIIALAVALLPSFSQAWLPTSSSRTTRTVGGGGVAAVFSSSSSSSSSNSNDFNVVLSPSEHDDAFDNFKIGNARVHRYNRSENDSDNSSGEQLTEYVMWYHGRSKELHNDDKINIPPLSTGRIGRAVSRNGLVWNKEGVSASEDKHDVSLGLNQESWWGFDTTHLGLGNVLLPLQTPAVMSEGGVYLMYYMGGSGEETKMAEYVNLEQLPEHLQDQTLQGMKMKIGVALSQDGVTWGRIEGDDPSGAIVVPYDKNDPNIPKDNNFDNVQEELYCAWPEVIVRTDDKTPKDESFVMYYSTMTKDDKEKCIACAVSADGFRFYQRGVCLRPTPDSLDAGGCARCGVFQDAIFDPDTNTWKEVPNSWKMYYEGVSPEDNKHRILMAESTDGKTWKKLGLALDVGEDGTWDCNGVGSPHCIRLDDGTSRMYYTGQGADGSTAIGVAKLGGAGSEWVREQATISFAAE